MNPNSNTKKPEMVSKHVRRVDQLDAVVLENELFALLNAQYRKVLACIPSRLIATNGQEFDLLFRLLFKYLPLSFLSGTFGHHVFSLKYYDDNLSSASKSKLSLLALFDTCFPWVWDRVLKKLLGNVVGGEHSSKLEFQLITLWKLLSLANFCVFLQKSQFPTVSERILRIRPLYTSHPEIQLPQYDGIARELLWHGLSELLGFILPLVNVFRIKNFVNNFWFSLNSSNRLKYQFMTSYCLVCGEIPNFPHTMGCRHVFCYYCLASRVLADPYFKCVCCKVTADGIECIKPVPINKPDGKFSAKKNC